MGMVTYINMTMNTESKKNATAETAPYPCKGEGCDCMDAAGRATHGAVAEDGRVQNTHLHPNSPPCRGRGLGSGVGLLHLLHLSSPALPVGAYSYSQGLEYTVEAQWVRDEAGALDWIAGLLSHTLAHLDVPVAARLYHAWQHDDATEVLRWSQFLLANREARELQDEDRNMGLSLARLLNDLGMPEAAAWCKADSVCFLTLFTLAAQRWQIALPDAVHGYLWSWAENQVLSAVKLIPLGQTAGQRLLTQLIPRIAQAVDFGLALHDDDIGFSAPGLAVAGALHETQYSRLFRS